MAVVVMVVVLAPCSDTSLVVQNTSIVLPVSVVYGLQWQIGKKKFGRDLRNSVLCKRKILHQDVETFILFIQELSHPPEERGRKKSAKSDNGS